MKNFEKLVNESFNIMNITISDKDRDSGENIKNAVKNYYEILIYNIVSISVVIAIANNVTKLTPIHMDHVKDYIKTKCTSNKIKGGNKNQTGGTSLPGEYFGYSIDPSRYSAGNGGEESTSTINFYDNTARAAINTTLNYTGTIVGGSNSSQLKHFVCTNSVVKSYIKELLKRHNISISKSANDILLHLIEIHIHCVLKDLHDASPLTLSKVNKIFHNKRHSIFH